MHMVTHDTKPYQSVGIELNQYIGSIHTYHILVFDNQLVVWCLVQHSFHPCMFVNILSFLYPWWSVKCKMLGVECRMQSVECRMSRVQYGVLSVECGLFYLQLSNLRFSTVISTQFSGAYFSRILCKAVFLFRRFIKCVSEISCNHWKFSAVILGRQHEKLPTKSQQLIFLSDESMHVLKVDELRTFHKLY